MSRIGRQPVPVPPGVDVTIDGQNLSVKGPKGTLEMSVAEPITVSRNDDGTILVNRPNDERRNRSLHGLSRTLVSNLVTGVTQGAIGSVAFVSQVPQGQTSAAGHNILLGSGSADVTATHTGNVYRTVIDTSGILQRCASSTNADDRVMRLAIAAEALRAHGDAHYLETGGLRLATKLAGAG